MNEQNDIPSDEPEGSSLPDGTAMFVIIVVILVIGAAIALSTQPTIQSHINYAL